MEEIQVDHDKGTNIRADALTQVLQNVNLIESSRTLQLNYGCAQCVVSMLQNGAPQLDRGGGDGSNL